MHADKVTNSDLRSKARETPVFFHFFTSEHPYGARMELRGSTKVVGNFFLLCNRNTRMERLILGGSLTNALHLCINIFQHNVEAHAGPNSLWQVSEFDCSTKDKNKFIFAQCFLLLLWGAAGRVISVPDQ